LASSIARRGWECSASRRLSRDLRAAEVGGALGLVVGEEEPSGDHGEAGDERRRAQDAFEHGG
jgi:hypothetical protein